MKIKKLHIIFFVVIILLSGCRYKEGPLISFRSVEKRLLGYWQVVGLTSNGIDSLQYYNDSCGSLVLFTDIEQMTSERKYCMFFNFHKSNEFGASSNFSYDNYNGSKKVLHVDFGNQKKIIGPIGYGKSDWRILKLEYKKMKISTSVNGRNYIISFNRSNL